MKLIQKSIPAILAIIVFGTTPSADADRYNNFNVNHDLVIRHAQDLQYIAGDLKDCFKDQFRYSRSFGKLVSKSNRLKNRARSLHRHGLSRGQCNWSNEIRQINEIVYGMKDLVNEAVHRSRIGYDKPLCPIAVRTVYKLIGKAEFHTNGLEKALYRVSSSRPVYPTPRCEVPNRFGPNLNGPIIDQPAPNFAPNNGIGFGVYRGTNNFDRQSFYAKTKSRQNSAFQVRRKNGLDYGPNGLAVNIGGFRFYVDK